MAAVQKQFDDFHDRIKLDEDDEKANLREKRDVLLRALNSELPDDLPAFTPFHQGSYAMGTGVVPVDGNYDIDVGLVFDCDRSAYPDPVALKVKVRDALDTHGRTVKIRRPCVAVNYMRGEEVDFHVDLAIYAKRSDGTLDLAKGKEFSSEEQRVWEQSDPRRLTEVISGRFTDAADAAQYRRCIRYLKRWRDVKFYSGGPLSIALTVAAYRWFSPNKTTNGTYLDLLALLDWSKSMLARFDFAWTDEGLHERLQVELPVTPNVDLMGWMSKSQMSTFQVVLKSLVEALEEAYDETLPEAAGKILNKQFGDDFVVPPKCDTAKTVGPAVVHTGNQG